MFWGIGLFCFFSSALLFILPSAFPMDSVTLMYLCGLSVFRFKLQAMARHLILCICILATGLIEDYKDWISSFVFLRIKQADSSGFAMKGSDIGDDADVICDVDLVIRGKPIYCIILLLIL